MASQYLFGESNCGIFIGNFKRTLNILWMQTVFLLLSSSNFNGISKIIMVFFQKMTPFYRIIYTVVEKFVPYRICGNSILIDNDCVNIQWIICCNMVLTVLIKQAEHVIRRMEIDVPMPMNTIRCYSTSFIVASGIVFMHSKYVAITVETLYNTVNFCWSTHKRHSIARPKGRGMGCLLWVQRATYCADLSKLSSMKYLL